MANSLITPFFLPLLFILLTTTAVLENVVLVGGDPDLTFISAWCGTEHDASSFRKGQATRLTNTAIDLAIPGGPLCSVTEEKKGTPLMYSMATCSNSTTKADCIACFVYARDQLLNYNICHDQYGARISVASCSMRYETYPIRPECPFT